MVAIQLNIAKENGSNQNVATPQDQKHSGLTFLWSIFHIFYSVFFYYCSVFLIATACALWYYDIDQNFLCTGIKRIIRYHIGSITYAAVLITIITTLKQMANNARD